MTGSSSASLVIGIASSPAERRWLAQLVGGTAVCLIVSSVEQAREFLDVAGKPAAAALVPLGPTAIAAPVADGGTPPPPDLSVDSDRRVLRWLDREVELTRLEHDFLHCLVGVPGQIWTYERLHLEVWGNMHLGRGSDMHSVARRIRRKLAGLEASTTIHAVRGVGFRLAER